MNIDIAASQAAAQQELVRRGVYGIWIWLPWTKPQKRVKGVGISLLIFCAFISDFGKQVLPAWH